MTYLLDFLQLVSTAAVLATIAAVAVPVWRDVVVKWIAGRIQLRVDYSLVEVLESRLLAATQDMLSGKEADIASLEHAQSIMKAATRAAVEPLDAKIPEDLKGEATPAELPGS